MRNNYLFIMLSLLLALSCRRAPEAIYTIEKTEIADSMMVVSAHPLASEAGLEVLRAGGNAVDAAIAVQFALAVVYPVAGNIGGGGFMMVRTAEGETAALDFREKAPGAATRNMYLDSLGNVIESLSIDGHLAAGVPGTVDGMFKAHERYGNLPMAQLIEPAIRLAHEGFRLTERQAGGLNRNQDDFRAFNTSMPVFVREEPWQPGDRLVQSDLAATLERIRQQGRDGFYAGKTADLIVAEMEAGGGLISREDLREYQAKWRDPVIIDYDEYRMISMPPPSSGGVALGQLLGMVAPYPLHEYGFHTTDAVHLMVEAERRVYADRAQHLGDSDYYPVPVDSLLNRGYLRARMASFDSTLATPSSTIEAGAFAMLSESEETTHFSVVDAEGNAVSVTTTINGGYGCNTVVSGAGFLLNNEMDDFSAKPGVPNMFGLLGAEANAIEPGKRMLSSMTPTIVEKNGQLFMVVGTPGGATIITSVFQTILNVIEFDMTMSEAVTAPRFHHQWMPDVITVEEGGLPESVRTELENRGHEFRERSAIGRVDAILVLPDGRLEGAADPRGDDHTAGE